MDVKSYDIRDVKLLTPRIFRDRRGFFVESYNQRAFAEAGITTTFVQDNHSRSVKGTLRGLHFQVNEEQAKLVRCIRGRIFDVAVDIRPGSPTFGQWVGEELSEDNMSQLFVPRGFAHGFQVLSETAEITYKCDGFYSPKDERGIIWNDPKLAIQWPGEGEPVLSDKDIANGTLDDVNLDELPRYE